MATGTVVVVTTYENNKEYYLADVILYSAGEQKSVIDEQQNRDGTGKIVIWSPNLIDAHFFENDDDALDIADVFVEKHRDFDIAAKSIDS